MSCRAVDSRAIAPWTRCVKLMFLSACTSMQPNQEQIPIVEELTEDGQPLQPCCKASSPCPRQYHSQ